MEPSKSIEFEKGLQSCIATLRKSAGDASAGPAATNIAKYMVQDSTFTQTWSAVGGATGLAAIMASLSVNNVRALCRELGKKLQRSGSGSQRRKAMTELMAVLCPDPGAPEIGTVSGDFRPLRKEYSMIAPACDAETLARWKEHPELLHSSTKKYVGSHWPIIVFQSERQPILDQFFSSEKGNETRDFSSLLALIRYDIQIAFTVLERFAESETLYGLTSKQFVEQLTIPLARRCEKRRPDRDQHLAFSSRFWHLLIKCLQKHPSLRKFIDMDVQSYHNTNSYTRGILAYAVQYRRLNCKRQGPENEEILAQLFSLIPEPLAKGCIKLEKLLKCTPTDTRYRLLRLFFLHTRRLDIGHIETMNPLAFDPDWFSISLDLLLLFPSREALILMDHYFTIYPEHTEAIRHDTSGHGLLGCRLDPHACGADTYLLRAYFHQAKPYWKALDTGCNEFRIEEQMEKRRINAKQGRTSETRLFWAESAIALSICAGDIKLFVETIRWVRRFNKDPLTIMHLYNSKVIKDADNWDMLSVIENANKRIRTRYLAPDVKHRVQQSNEAMLELVKTAIMALREPGFSLHHWQSVLELIPTVVTKRLENINYFQDRCKISDEQIFNDIWRPTIDMLIETEKLFIHPGNKGLERNDPRGFMRFNIFQNSRYPTMRFLDGLAKARNNVWVEHRLFLNPAVQSLEAPWPQGLPVQHLLHLNVNRSHDCEAYESWISLPYLECRAEAVLLGDPHKLLAPPPNDAESQEAIGQYVNSWSEALSIYLRGKSPQIRKQRTQNVWKHATVKLSKNRMSIEEGRRFWLEHIFLSWQMAAELEIQKPKPDLDEFSAPYLPVAKGRTDPIEWNPDSIFGDMERLSHVLPTSTTRELEPTCLDALLDPIHGFPYKRISIISVNPVIPRPNFWSYTEYRYINAEDTDNVLRHAILVAAMLYLNSHLGSDTSFMMKPFTSDKGEEFPAVFLKEDFLERSDYTVNDAMNVLQRHWRALPSKLLTQLAMSLLQRVQEEENNSKMDTKRFLLRIITMILKSDIPQMGISLATHFITDLPGESAWHRHLFNVAYLDSLAPAHARNFVEDVSRALLETHKGFIEQLRSGQISNAPVKVSTFKMVAQVLREISAVPNAVVTRLLIEILRGTSHVDIHIQVFKSLAATIADTNDQNLEDLLINTIEQSSVSALNERQPETELDWEDAERGEQLPEVWDATANDPPLMTWLIEEVSKGRTRKKTWPSKVLLRVLQKSAEANQRWTVLFLKKYGLNLPESEQLPKLPSSQDSLQKTLEAHSDNIPTDVFYTMRHHVLLNLSPGPGLSAVIEYVRSNAELARSNAGKHWLALWGRGKHGILDLGVTWAAIRLNSLCRNIHGRSKTPQEIAMIEEFLLKIIDILLEKSEIHLLEGLMCSLQFADAFSPSYIQLCGAKGTILQRIISKIDMLRTPEWQMDNNRQPSILPETFSLKLQQMPSLKTPKTPATMTAAVASVAAHIITTLNNLAMSGEPYHEELIIIKRTLSSDPHDLRVHLRGIVLLGTAPAVVQRTVPNLSDYLRVDLAKGILEAYYKKNIITGFSYGDGSDEARHMLRLWAGSSVEKFRLAARGFPTYDL